MADRRTDIQAIAFTRPIDGLEDGLAHVVWSRAGRNAGAGNSAAARRRDCDSADQNIVADTAHPTIPKIAMVE